MNQLVLLGIVCWLVTLVVVDSELFRPLRIWVAGHRRGADRLPRRPAWLWHKLRYLVACHLCTGVWVGLVLAAAVPTVRPFGTGPVGFVLAGLSVKAVGHLTLEVAALLARTNTRP